MFLCLYYSILKPHIPYTLGGPTNEDSEKLGSSLSPETSEVPSFPVSDVETALVEAGKSQVSGQKGDSCDSFS